MTDKINSIKCRFCDWSTHKWGYGSNPTKAFVRLAEHIKDTHPEMAKAIAKLCSIDEDEDYPYE